MGLDTWLKARCRVSVVVHLASSPSGLLSSSTSGREEGQYGLAMECLAPTHLSTLVMVRAAGRQRSASRERERKPHLQPYLGTPPTSASTHGEVKKHKK